MHGDVCMHACARLQCRRTNAGATGAAWTGAFLMSLGRKLPEEDGAGVPRLATTTLLARGATVA